jgi:acetyltransferase-like isoleucine patch superfamily enzyme
MKILWLFKESIRGLIEWIISPIPGPPGYAIRWLYYKLILAHLGWGTLIDVGVRIENPNTVSIGSRSWIDRNVLLLGALKDPLKGRPGRWVRRDPQLEGRVVIGDRTHIAPNCVLSGMAGLSIGSDCGLATGTIIYSLSGHYRSPDTGAIALFTSRAARNQQFMIAGPVEVGNRCGTGIYSVLLPGSRLAPDAFLLACSVLNFGGDTEENWLYQGDPAKPTRRRVRS